MYPCIFFSYSRYLPEKSLQPDSGFEDKSSIQSEENEKSITQQSQLETAERNLNTSNSPYPDNSSSSSLPKTAPERRDSLTSSTESSTHLKTVHAARAEVDSGCGSVISDASDESLTQAKYLANAQPPPIAENPATPRQTQPFTGGQEQNSNAESLASGESQTIPMSRGEAARSAERAQDHKLQMEADRLLEGAPKLNMSSVATSSVRSDPVEDDEKSLTEDDLLISLSTTG